MAKLRLATLNGITLPEPASMPHSVVDFKSVPLGTREQMDTMLAHLSRDNPDAEWVIVVAVKPHDTTPLERLYALCHSLLQATNANPMSRLECVGMDGKVADFSFMQIMVEGREAIDQS